MKKSLKLISSEYLKKYSNRCRLNMTEIRKLRSKEISIKDFDHYFVASSLFSSKIEGNSLDFNSFYRNRGKTWFKSKEIGEIENLVSAYKFASKKRLTQDNFLQAHRILSATLMPFFQRGKYRKGRMGVYTSTGELVYMAVEWELVPEEMDKLFSDIHYLLRVKLSNKEIFYYASMIHLWIAKIHPFNDGNGRSARLLEKWFLASKLGESVWSITSERYYWENLRDYYANISLGVNYYFLSWSKCLSFLLMLPKSLSEK
jgi:Fic family protein